MEELEGRLTQEEVHRQLAENEVETLRHSLHHELEIKEDTQEKMEEVRTHTHTHTHTLPCLYMLSTNTTISTLTKIVDGWFMHIRSHIIIMICTLRVLS